MRYHFAAPPTQLITTAVMPLSKQEMTMLKHAEQIASEVLADAKLESVSGGHTLSEIIAAVKQICPTGSSAEGTAGGIVGGAVGAVYGFLFG
jgi:hypothetical protein